MNFDYYVMILFWIVIPIILWKVIPRSRIREAIAALLVFQMLTWLFSIGLTYAGLLYSPIRFFEEATTINFTMEYLLFPSVAVLFYLKFPQNANFTRRMVHYLFWVGVILSIMILLGTFTNLMVVRLDHLIRSFFNFLIELWICRHYVLWVTEQFETKRVS
ncbi:hypothetical protein SAMN05216389_12260 [Oceanobacillus limi]|uniref:Uncharacterized protein n=1 Tax=Oceanobacillus limi TaxID=930131 RepID=A0A1I0GL44_9BACI|nr:CBO0543 family protein [Oceanobacillus limi]SET71677.1 hypothetical protein SAMN05216389_12260 [Oceanobacillus limi]